jgi:putative transcriptional regulator
MSKAQLTPICRIGEWRRRQGMTQVQLAHELGVDPQTVRNWEASRNGLKEFVRLARLCELLQCGPADLFAWKEVTLTAKPAKRQGADVQSGMAFDLDLARSALASGASPEDVRFLLSEGEKYQQIAQQRGPEKAEQYAEMMVQAALRQNQEAEQSQGLSRSEPLEEQEASL